MSINQAKNSSFLNLLPFTVLSSWKPCSCYISFPAQQNLQEGALRIHGAFLYLCRSFPLLPRTLLNTVPLPPHRQMSTFLQLHMRWIAPAGTCRVLPSTISCVQGICLFVCFLREFHCSPGWPAETQGSPSVSVPWLFKKTCLSHHAHLARNLFLCNKFYWFCFLNQPSFLQDAVRGGSTALLVFEKL